MTAAPAGSSTSAPTIGVNDPGGRRRSHQRTEQHGRVEAVPVQHRQIGVVTEVRCDIAVRCGQRDPQLQPAQVTRGPGGRGLRVADAAAGGHQVELAGPDQLVVAEAVLVADPPVEQPGHRLQPGVGVRRHLHRSGAADVLRPVVVQEAPRPDGAQVTVREGPADMHRPRPAERHVARGEHPQALPRRRDRAGECLGRPLLEVAHATEGTTAGSRLMGSDRPGRPGTPPASTSRAPSGREQPRHRRPRPTGRPASAAAGRGAGPADP